MKDLIRKILKEEKDLLATSAETLIRSLPTELKDLLFSQWDAKQNPKWHPEGNTSYIKSIRLFNTYLLFLNVTLTFST